MKIVGFIKTTLLDWEGKIASIIFVGGCNFRCLFCYNKDLVLFSESLKEVDKGEIFDYLKKNKDFIDGVVISGGEPLINKEIVDLIKEIKMEGFEVKIDTNGSDPKMLKDLIDSKLIDSISMDIKTSLNEKYKKIVGVDCDIEKIKESIKIIMKSDVEYEFRTTVVPFYVNKEDIENICKFIEGSKKYRLQKFIPKKVLDDSILSIKPYSEKELVEMLKIAKKYVKNTKIKGGY